METTKRRPQWLLDLGHIVDDGRKPWLPMILAGLLPAPTVFAVQVVIDLAGIADGGTPGSERVVNLLLAGTIVLAWIMIPLGIVFFFVCLYAHYVWLSLSDDERLEVARARLERMDEFLEELDRPRGGDGVAGVRVRRRVWRRA
jgi:hypothetical protein